MIRLFCLIENHTIDPALHFEHGLSLYIETTTQKILMDMGATAAFAENAKTMGVDLSEVDIAIVSHGHYDHGGGLEHFLSINSKAKIYIHKRAFEAHYSQRRGGEMAYIGINPSLKNHPQIVLTEGKTQLTKDIHLFSGIKGYGFYPRGNALMHLAPQAVGALDDFEHEQSLLILGENNSIVLTGCSHCGITNIIEHIATNSGIKPTVIVGGMHMYSKANPLSETPFTVEAVAHWLHKGNYHVYTGHCTGPIAFDIMKSTLGNQIEMIFSGWTKSIL
jgi:7,8-dihydropterin-6-yl-methyl-4-(beta-D-ribofuranosyl)aminobenzene 5'-phosphate synthase